MNRAWTSSIAFIGLLAAGTALGADQQIPGKVGLVKPSSLLKIVSKAKDFLFDVPTPGGAADPTIHGAHLRFFDTPSGANGAGDLIFNLDASGWKGLGNPPGSKGYKYTGKDATPADDVCKIVLLKEKVLKAVCKSRNESLSFTTPLEGDLGVILGIPTGTASATQQRYCAQLGGSTIKNDDKKMKRKDAPQPGMCPEVVPMIGQHECIFDDTSEMEVLTSLALAPFPLDGAMGIDCGAIDEGTGKAPCSCSLQFLGSIEVIAVGFLCFTPGSDCPAGEIDCDGGNALDVTMDSDHNIGTCTGNADCENLCQTHCSVLGLDYYASGCEGYCLGGADDGDPCDNDTDCPGGACVGRNEPGQHDDVCQCDCLGIGGTPSSAGALQCNLPVDINIEANGPCGDGDVIIVIGTRCLPLTSETVVSQIHDRNGTSGLNFPNPAFMASGTGIDCSDLTGSITTGLNLVGSLNFFDFTIGDLHTQQTLTCE